MLHLYALLEKTQAEVIQEEGGILMFETHTKS